MKMFKGIVIMYLFTEKGLYFLMLAKLKGLKNCNKKGSKFRIHVIIFAWAAEFGRSFKS